MIIRPLLLWWFGTIILFIGYLSFLSGFLIFLVAILMWWNGYGFSIPDSSLESLDVLLISLFFAVTGYWVFYYAASLRYKARKKMAPNAINIMQKDPRPPILYLRSFNDDELEVGIQSGVSSLWANGDLLIGLVNSFLISLLGFADQATDTQEEVLAKYMRQCGPFIAIGDPKEDLPALGAARLNVDSENWQSVVVDIMKRARLIVIRPGTSNGLHWEIEKALEILPSDRIMFWIPETGYGQSSLSYKALQKILTSKIGYQLPKWKEEIPCLCFGQNWSKPQFLRLKDVFQSNGLFFTTSMLKFVVMSICTLGLYERYWFYRNWLLINGRSRYRIMPFWRAFFSPIWVFSLFKNIKISVRENNSKTSMPINFLAITYFFLHVMFWFSKLNWNIYFLFFLPILPINKLLLNLNQKLSTVSHNNEKFSGWNWVAIILFCSIFWLFKIDMQ